MIARPLALFVFVCVPLAALSAATRLLLLARMIFVASLELRELDRFEREGG